MQDDLEQVGAELAVTDLGISEGRGLWAWRVVPCSVDESCLDGS